MMNRVRILLLMLMAVSVSVMHAQLAARDKLDRDAVQLKTTPLKTNQWGSHYLASMNGEIEDILWDFENGTAFDVWDEVDSDGDGYSWSVLEDAHYAHSGEVCLLSESYIAGYGALFPDNWLISPQVPLSGTLSLWAMNYSSTYPDLFAVYACVGGDPRNLNNYVRVSDDLYPGSSWEKFTFDLSQYGGQMGCIAIRHYNCGDMYKLLIDDISITRSQTPVPVITCEDTGLDVVVTATGEGHIWLYMEDTLVAEGEGIAQYTIPYGDDYMEYSFAANAQDIGKTISDYAVLTVDVPAIPVYQTPEPIINCEMTDFTMIITALGEGTVTLYVQSFDDGNGEPTTMTYFGEGEASVEIPRTDEYRYFSVWAIAIVDGGLPGITSTQFIEIPPIEPVMTDPPVMYCDETEDGIIIYAYGEGHICLYWEGILVVDGYEFVEYFIPCGDIEEVYYFTATAQGEGMLVSPYSELTVVVPARPVPEIAPAPEIVVEEEDEFFVIYAYAEFGEVFLFVNGEPVDNPYFAYMTDEEQVIHVLAYTVADGYEPSEEVSYDIVIPAKVHVLVGDADGDGMITINDVTIILDMILSHQNEGINLPEIDVDEDGEITVNDVTTLIDRILTGGL